MPTETALLAEAPFFQVLDDQERQELSTQLDIVHLAAGELVFSYGDPGDSLYVVRRGGAEVFVKDDTGTRIVLETVGPGEVFGELSLLDGGPRTASVVVTADMEALRLDRAGLDLFLQRRPGAALDMLTAMGRRLRVTAEKLRHTASRNVNQEAEDRRSRVEKVADWIAEFSGSISFLNIHVVLFFGWIILNVGWIQRFDAGWIKGISGFDPFPFGLLTMAVSLEAIFLSVFVLLSQNRHTTKDHIRADIEYEVNLKAELEVAHLHEKLDRFIADSAAHFNRLGKALGQ